MTIDETINAGVHEAFEADDLLTTEGKRDLPKMRARIFEAVARAKVLNKGERATKSLSRGGLIATVFPNLPGPDDYADEEDPEVRDIAKAVYSAINQLVWAAATDAPNGPIQRMVGIVMGNGYVLCRARVGPDRVDAVYITDDIDCIRLDFTRPDNEGLERKIKGSTDKRAMLVMRQPQNARAYAGELSKTLKTALASSSSSIQLALDAVASRIDDSYPPDADEADDIETAE